MYSERIDLLLLLTPNGPVEWLQDHVWPAEGFWASPEFCRFGGELSIAEMIKGGTTTANDMYWFVESMVPAVKNAHFRMMVSAAVIAFPFSTYGKCADDYIKIGCDFFEKYANDPNVIPAWGPHAVYTVPDDSMAEIGRLSVKYDSKVHIHLHESASEMEMSHDQSGKRPMTRLADANMINERLIAVHMTQLTDEEIQLLAEKKVSVVTCPASNMKLASGLCPVDKLMAAGVNVAIGTDSSTSNNDLDMLQEMRLTALLSKVTTMNAASIPAAQALQMATLNGAKALGLEKDLGSIEVGKLADLVGISLLSGVETVPMYDPIAHIVYTSNRAEVQHVWIAGTKVLSNGKLVHIDEPKLVKEAVAWGTKIKEWKEGQNIA